MDMWITTTTASYLFIIVVVISAYYLPLPTGRDVIIVWEYLENMRRTLANVSIIDINYPLCPRTSIPDLGALITDYL